MRASTFTLASAGLIAQALAAYVPSEPWSTLTPEGSIAGAYTHYTKTFAISIDPIQTASASSLAKRDVITQIGDGQIQAPTATTQAEAPKVTAQVVSQIGDGQIQATTQTTEPPAPKVTAEVVSQIGDGQIQATTKTVEHAPVVTQIGDGQIQASTATASVATQIGDGQIQAHPSAAPQESSPVDEYGFPESCKSPNALQMTLEDGLLFDGKGRVGSIVANRQFQFDGPPPQAGAIYAAGWSVTRDGNLAIGSEQIFYQCLSGNFYNLYDESIGAQCIPVYLKVVDLVDC